MAIINPLTDKHCDALDCVLGALPNIKDTIAACESCGMDMTAEKARVSAQEEFASSVKRTFNPLAS